MFVGPPLDVNGPMGGKSVLSDSYYKAWKFDYLADVSYLVDKLDIPPAEKEKALSLAKQVAENITQIHRILDASHAKKSDEP